MSLQVEKLEHNMAKLTIEVDAAEFKNAMTKAYNKQKKSFNVPGFRKGKVPQAYIEKIYGPEVFYEEAANSIIPEAYAREIQDCDLEILSRPEIDIEQIEKGKSFIFTAEVALKPEVTLGEYKGLEAPVEVEEVTEEEVPEVPQTFDALGIYAGIGFISIAGITGAVIYLKKRNA